VAGCREAVVDRETGFLVPPHDVGAVAERLEMLIGDARLRQRFGAAGRARVLAEFADGIVVGRMLAVYAAGAS
jgi:glycosyltransferase involved in cell wall biosynthesis